MVRCAPPDVINSLLMGVLHELRSTALVSWSVASVVVGECPLRRFLKCAKHEVVAMWSHTTGTVHDGNTLRYRASKFDCEVCALKTKCCPKPKAFDVAYWPKASVRASQRYVRIWG